jgi:hypothetical protein
MNEEIFKDIPWYEGLYQVSNMWNIKSLNYNRTKKERILKSSNWMHWYPMVILFNNLISKSHQIHRLVALAFLDNPENKPYVNHKNWIRNDNNLGNLEWCTWSENHLHKFKVLWYKFLNNKWKHLKKKVNQYDKQWNFIKTWDSIKDIQRELWFNYSGVSNCCRWKLKTSFKFIWRFV